MTIKNFGQEFNHATNPEELIKLAKLLETYGITWIKGFPKFACVGENAHALDSMFCSIGVKVLRKEWEIYKTRKGKNGKSA